MLFFTFLKPPSSCTYRIIHFLSLITLVLGGILYAYFTGEAINWTIKFPPGNQLELPMWLMHISLRILCLWMPASLILIRWDVQHRPIAAVYVTGCALAILFSVGATVLIDKFKKPEFVKDDYARLINESIKTYSRLPANVASGASNYNCCGWEGPTDFGGTFDISNKVDKDIEFMNQVKACYGDTFTVQKLENGSLAYNRGPKSMTDIPKGCCLMYKSMAHRICFGISSAGIIIDILGLAFIGLYVLVWCSKTHRDTSLLAPVESPTDFDKLVERHGKTSNNTRNNSNVPPAPENDANYIVRLPSRHSEM